jgi:addiction module HigA family antidote
MSINIEDIRTTDYSDVTVRGKNIPPTKPGAILLHDFMEPLDMSANALARELGVAANRITTILNGTRAVTAETALMLAYYFGTTPEFWLNLQTHFELEKAQAKVADKLAAITPRETVAA